MIKAFINAAVVSGGEILHGKTVLVEDGIIAGLTGQKPSGVDIYDAKGLFLSAGFIDLHVHGGNGFDFSDGTREAFEGAAALHLRHGTTTLMPALVAGPHQEMKDCFAVMSDIKQSGSKIPLPNMLGLHLEGPFLSAKQAGAINPEFLKIPDAPSIRYLLSHKDVLGRVTIAPELPGGIEAIKLLSQAGIMVSLGHSDAGYTEVLQATTGGASLVTHLYSTMSSITRVKGLRILGLLECAYYLDELAVEIIADGIHLPPELLRLIVKTKNNQQICLVTDAMRGAGMPPDSKAMLGSVSCGKEVLIENGVAYLPDHSAFAGSVCTADRCIRVMYQMAGVPLAHAVGMMTENPARIAGIVDKKGTVSTGADADLVLFDENIAIHGVFLKGVQV